MRRRLFAFKTDQQAVARAWQNMKAHHSLIRQVKHAKEQRNTSMCSLLTVSLKLSESQRFLNTATTDEGGLSRSSKASIRMKSNTMSKKFIHTTWRDRVNWRDCCFPLFLGFHKNPSELIYFFFFFNCTHLRVWLHFMRDKLKTITWY